MGIFGKVRWALRKKKYSNKQKNELKDFEDAIRNDPNNPILWDDKAKLLTEIDRWDPKKHQENVDNATSCFVKALECYENAIKNDPNNSDLWVRKGIVLIHLDRFEEAICCYDEAIKNDPNNPNLWISQGIIFTKLKKYEKGIQCYYSAIKCYDEAIKKDPNDSQAWMNKGTALFELGYFRKAHKCYEYGHVNDFDLTYAEVIGVKEDRTKVSPIWNYRGLPEHVRGDMHKTHSRRFYGSGYLIEFRFSGYAKQAIKELTQNISKNFHTTRKKIVPHVTLVGQLYTNDEKKLIKEVVSVCKKYELIKFQLDGFDNFENRVIYVKIKPSEELKKLRLELAERLGEFCELSPFDKELEFTFHATLVMKDIQRKFDRIWDYLQTWQFPKMDQHLIRITIIKKGKILVEYDFVQRKTLDRNKSLDREIFHKTRTKLEKIRKPSEIKFEEITLNGKIFVFSDTHFDHRNIIRYCHRPFNSTGQMNQELLRNWNHVVGENNKVYFLGDMSYGRDRHPIDYWLGKLNGTISYIRGNHDSDIITRATVMSNRVGIKYNDYEFLLMHDPHRPLGYEGWIIHGDKHNNDLKNYPFINQKNKTVNVCAELVGYTPLNLDRLITMIETGRNYNTIND